MQHRRSITASNRPSALKDPEFQKKLHPREDASGVQKQPSSSADSPNAGGRSMTGPQMRSARLEMSSSLETSGDGYHSFLLQGTDIGTDIAATSH